MNTSVVMRERKHHNRRERAFSVVELIALVAAAFIFAALIVPALGRSGDHGARTICLNNLRQMGLAANMYAGDNLDYLAYCNFDGGAAVAPGWLYNIKGGGSIPNPNLLPYRSNPITAWQGGLWFKYAQDPKYYLCPVDVESQDYVHARRPNMLSSYVMDGAQCNFGSGSGVSAPLMSKVTDVWSPECWLLWEPDSSIEGGGSGIAYNDGANFISAGEGPGSIHTASGAEILTVAGNVRFATAQNIQTIERTNGPGPGGKTLAAWSPFTANGH